MRISTTVLVRAIIVVAVAAVFVPQQSFSQLNLETRKLIIQGSTSGGLTLEAPATVTSYSLTLPGAAPTAGSLMYKGASGMLWTNTASDGAVLTTDGTSVSWASPSASANKNWSIQGNSLTGTGIFGTITTQDISFITDNVTRMTMKSGGAIGVKTASPTTDFDVNGTFNASGASTFGSTVDITGNLTVGSTKFTVAAGSGNTAIGGTLGVTLATTLSSTLGVTGATTLSSTLAVTGAATMASTLAVSGDFSVGTDKFTVNASNGNTVVAGTLSQTAGQVTFGGNVDATNGLDVTNANFTVGTSNFTVAHASGNTAIAGTLGVTGATTLSSTLAVTGTSTLTGNVDALAGLDVTGSDLTVGTDKFTVNPTTGVTTVKGSLKLSGATSPLLMDTDPGTSGYVLVSGGAATTPSWSSIGSAIGIRAAGNVTAAGVTSVSVSSITGMTSSDAIIITLQTTSGSTVVGTVTNRNDGAGSFDVTFSGSFTGKVNYLVIKTY